MKSARLHQQFERLFNIREGESLLVRQLFLHNFFQGTGIAFYFTAANALFLDFFSVKSLPWMYLLAGVLLIGTGRIYAYFEHHLQIRKFMIYVVAVLIVSPIFFYLGLTFWETSGVIFLLMASHRVLYTLNSLEFWGLSALAFDVQQSKRVFPLIGAGDIPAKLLGYLAVAVLVPYTGIESLLLFASVCFLLSFLFLQQLLGAQKEYFKSEDKYPDFEKTRKDRSKVLIKSVFKSNFLYWLSLLAVFTLVVLTLLDFAFLSEVKYSFKEKKELGQFFGMLFSIGYGLIIFIKFFFSGRIIEKLGVVRSAFILPFFLLLSGVAAFAVGLLPDGPSIMLWIFSVIIIGVDVIRYSIDDPNLMTLFQPLSRSLRLFGHTLIKALMQPIGLLLAAGVLIVLLYTNGKVSLMIVSGMMGLGSLILVLIAFRVKKHYILQLHKAVRTRYFEGNALLVNDEKTQRILAQQIETGTALQSIHSLELLDRKPPEHWTELLSKALKHESPDVRTFAIQLILKGNIKSLKDEIIHLLSADSSRQVQEAAIRSIPGLAAQHIEKLYSFLDAEHASLKTAAYATLLSSQNLKAVIHAGKKILKFFHSDIKEDRILACRVIGTMGHQNDYQLLLPLFRDREIEVQKAAIWASAKVLHPQMLEPLISFFKEHPHWPEVHHSISSFQEKAIPQIEHLIQSNYDSIDINFYLSSILSKIKGAQSDRTLLRLLEHDYSNIRGRALSALKRKKFRPSADQLRVIEAHFENKVELAFRLLHAEMNCKPDSPLLKSALHQYRRKIEGQLLTLLEFQFNPQRMQRVRESIYSKYPEFRAKALELLEYELPKYMYQPLSVLFDQQQGYDRIGKYDRIRPSKMDYPNNWRADILARECKIYDRWTVTMAIYTLQEGDEQYEKQIMELREHNDRIIREQAMLYLSPGQIKKKNGKIMQTQDQSTSQLLLIEKVLLLKNTNLFRESPEHILIDVAEITRELELAKGERLFDKGEMGDKMYVIATGTIRIHDGDHTFSQLGEHGIFGELALLDPEPRSASATAEEDSLLLYIDQDPFYELLSSHPEVAKGIMTILGSRLRAQNEEIVRIKKERK